LIDRGNHTKKKNHGHIKIHHKVPGGT